MIPGQDASGQAAQARLPCEYVVFSSHKTGTQTLTASLNESGYPAVHCHRVEDIGLQPAQFVEELARFRSQTGRKIRLFSAFRLPMERHISSFFQWYGVGAMRRIPGYTGKDSILASSDFRTLSRLFLGDLASGRLAGYPESIHDLKGILGFDNHDFRRDPEYNLLTFEHELVDICLFEFGSLMAHYPAPVIKVMQGRPFRGVLANISEGKWYARKYRAFKQHIWIPGDLIRQTYEYRRDLIELFFPGQYAGLLERDIRRYGGRPQANRGPLLWW